MFGRLRRMFSSHAEIDISSPVGKIKGFARQDWTLSPLTVSELNENDRLRQHLLHVWSTDKEKYNVLWIRKAQKKGSSAMLLKTPSNEYVLYYCTIDKSRRIHKERMGPSNPLYQKVKEYIIQHAKGDITANERHADQTKEEFDEFEEFEKLNRVPPMPSLTSPRTGFWPGFN